jgi:transposase-like protein
MDSLMKRISSNYLFYAKSRRERCPYCGFLDTIKWGKQSGHQRYKCKNCGSLFTARRKDISHKNRFVWFRWWVEGKQDYRADIGIERVQHTAVEDMVL